MPRAAAEVCVESLAAFSKGDTPALLETLHPEIEVIDDPRLPGAGTHHGHDGAAKYFESFRKFWATWEAELKETWVTGNVVLLLTRWSAVSKSGVSLDSPAGFLGEVEDGLIRRIQVYQGDLSRAEEDFNALAAASEG